MEIFPSGSPGSVIPYLRNWVLGDSVLGNTIHMYFLKRIWYSSSEERHNQIITEKKKWKEVVEIYNS